MHRVRIPSNVPDMTRTLLSLGHGYSARELAKTLLADGWTVIGTTRSEDKAEDIRATGAESAIWPGDDLTPLLKRATHLLVSIAPDEGGDPVLARDADKIAAAQHLQWVGYLSTTGVYGDHKGGWVDEDTPLTPGTKRGHQRVLAESQWQDIAAIFGLPLHIFRLAAIYGPGRGPFRKVEDGTARRIVKPDQFFSRIHVEDLASVLMASMKNPHPGAIYNTCDDDPCPPEDVIAHAAELLGVPVPPEVPIEEAGLTPLARSFYAESKRVRNDRMKRELGVKLRYPGYREGLAGLARAGGH